MNQSRLQQPSLLICACLLLCSTAISAATVTDDFNAGPTLSWGNESGAWNAAGGTYRAANPDNFPNAYSSLPYALSEFDLNVDIVNLADGGIWMHSEHTGTGSIGVRGILLVTLGSSIYWHDVTNDSSYGGSLLSAAHSGFSNIRITASDNGGSFTYRAFLDGSLTAASAYTSSSFASGQLALYANSSQQFDNLVLAASDSEIPAVVPVPAGVWLLGSGLVGLLLRNRSRKQV